MTTTSNQFNNTRNANPVNGDKDAYTVTTGAVIAHDPLTGDMTLTGTTFYIELGDGNTPADTALVSAHLRWAAAVAGVITVETCNFPVYQEGKERGVADVTGYSVTGGNWIPENPSTAIVAVSGTNNTSTAATVTAGGTNAGGCMFHLGNMGSRRVRLKLVLTVGGAVRCNVRGKVV